MTQRYVEIKASEVPGGLRWDTPARNMGQIVTVSYADAKPFAGEAGPGSLYRRTFDASDRTTTYEKLEARR